jgi:hypothetical protein
MKRTVLSALCTSLLMAAAPAMAVGLAGSMQGKVTQNDTSETYLISMTLDGASGHISYPADQCDGDLQFMSTDGITYRYKEHITHGDCIDGGVIQMHRRTAGDNTAWVWRWDAEDVNVRGVVQASGVAEGR